MPFDEIRFLRLYIYGKFEGANIYLQSTRDMKK